MDDGARPTVPVRWPRRVAVVAVLMVVLWPAVRGRDSFPLSTYPMYAETRGEVVSISTAVGIDAAGAQQRLSLRAIAATDDPLIAESTVDGAIRSGRADSLCATIAARVGSDVARVEVVDERHDVVARALGRPSLVSRAVRASCEAG